ncbi:hypothetical protein BKA62DRAFT_724349 [Auriculariales sp. MPI-PUGE-AT-0066]|nr:hypothetical protein BKA62DRAFT_724349 [Auriculariales sp. MPI-PUGE-AT-0066]
MKADVREFEEAYKQCKRCALLLRTPFLVMPSREERQALVHVEVDVETDDEDTDDEDDDDGDDGDEDNEVEEDDVDNEVADHAEDDSTAHEDAASGDLDRIATSLSTATTTDTMANEVTITAKQRRDSIEKKLVRCICCGAIRLNRDWSDSVEHRFVCPVAVALFERGEFTRWVLTHNIHKHKKAMKQLGEQKRFRRSLYREASLQARRQSVRADKALRQRPQLNFDADPDWRPKTGAMVNVAGPSSRK